MLIKTRNFGELELPEEKMINFPNGLIAFEDMKHFFVIENDDKEIPICWLQSAEKPDLAFAVMNPFLIKHDYEFELSAADREELGIKNTKEVAVFSIVVIPGDIRQLTTNLLAPLVINVSRKNGKQIVLQDKRYTINHSILEELRSNERGGVLHAGADKEAE